MGFFGRDINCPSIDFGVDKTSSVSAEDVESIIEKYEEKIDELTTQIKEKDERIEELESANSQSS